MKNKKLIKKIKESITIFETLKDSTEQENGYYQALKDILRLSKPKTIMKDTIVESVIEQFKERSETGINKYGVTLDRTDLTHLEWINHAQEEAMDMILYLEKLKQYEK